MHVDWRVDYKRAVRALCSCRRIISCWSSRSEALTVYARVAVLNRTLQAESHPVAAPSKTTPASSSADNKKRRLDDGSSAKQTAPLKLKIIKANGSGSGSKGAPVPNGSSKTTGANASSDAAAPVEGKKKKKKKKNKKNKNKAGAGDAPAAHTPVAKPKPANTSAIDDLFASLKTAKKEQARADEQKQKEEAKAAQRAQQEKQQLQAHIKKLEAQSACRSCSSFATCVAYTHAPSLRMLLTML